MNSLSPPVGCTADVTAKYKQHPVPVPNKVTGTGDKPQLGNGTGKALMLCKYALRDEVCCESHTCSS